MAAEIVAQIPVYDGWMSVRRLSLRMPDGAIEERHVECHGSAVAVLPYDPDRSVALLVSMPRPPVMLDGGPDLFEAIAGRIEGAHPDDEARREAAEEAGVRLGALEWVTNLWTMPSVSTERVQLYLAAYTDADRVGPGGGATDENEGITVHEVALSHLADLAQRGALTDAKTLILFQALQLRRPDLFHRPISSPPLPAP
jgi:nudix-type nucleoside diphosphatase (YffH/AdpP family)